MGIQDLVSSVVVVSLGINTSEERRLSSTEDRVWTQGQRREAESKAPTTGDQLRWMKSSVLQEVTSLG